MTKLPKIIAVTGTNGKSSVVGFLRQIFNALGHHACSWGTLGFIDHAGVQTPTNRDPNNPGHIFEVIQRKVAEVPYEIIACEAFSRSLVDHEWDSMTIAAAAFTSFAPDHLEKHKTLEEYWKAKTYLFEKILPVNAPAVINLPKDRTALLDPILKQRNADVLLIGESKELYFEKISESDAQTVGDLVVNGKRYRTTLPFFGDIMIENLLVAVGLVLKLGYSLDGIDKICQTLSLPQGRLEKIAVHNNASVFIDYAHTPDALEAILKNLKRITKGKVALVFGCGGGTESSKRYDMSAVASKWADVVYVTDDNSRLEDPADIRKALLSNCAHAIEVPGRINAIEVALQSLNAGDSLAITGKGHETSLDVNNVSIEHSDHGVVHEWIARHA